MPADFCTPDSNGNQYTIASTNTLWYLNTQWYFTANFQQSAREEQTDGQRQKEYRPGLLRRPLRTRRPTVLDPKALRHRPSTTPSKDQEYRYRGLVRRYPRPGRRTEPDGEI
jgi:hypothetical protein